MTPTVRSGFAGASVACFCCGSASLAAPPTDENSPVAIQAAEAISTATAAILWNLYLAM